MSSTNQKKLYHFIGIGGIGVSAVARILWQQGHQIQGSDVRESQLTLGLKDLGIKVFIGHDAHYVKGADYVVYSTAVPANNVEWLAAQEQEIPCIHRSQALAHCVQQHQSIGVVGTHGKGTVSAMIAHSLITMNYDPTFIIGGILNQYHCNARLGNGHTVSDQAIADTAISADKTSPTKAPYAVVEIDESDGSHLNMAVNFPARLRPN